MNRIAPKEALATMCYTSDRTYKGIVYTISDIRYPEYNGLQILMTLQYGKNIIEWYNPCPAVSG